VFRIAVHWNLAVNSNAIEQASYGTGQLLEGRMNVYVSESLAGSFLRN